MERAYDLVIRGGTVVDGTGGEPFEADVGVKDGVIAAVGKIGGAGAEEIDAKGQIVIPGFVDVHTHYDGQATWDERMQPSSWHGVTTVIMGNCGVGFAPCRPDDHDRLIRLMEGVEDIPFPVLADGLPWNWESYPDYVASLSNRRFDVDVGSQLPHAALRVYVMGERGVNREPATEADINAMAAIAKRSMEAGAIGFGSSRTLNHRSSDGSPIATLTAGEDELTGIAMGLAAAGRGVLQFVSDFNDPEAEFDMLERLVEKSGRPLSFSLVQSPRDPLQYRYLLQRLSAAKARGLTMRAQVASRPVGVLFGLELTVNPFSSHPSYRAIKDRPFAERVAALRDPEFRARLLAEEPESPRAPGISSARPWDRIYLMGEAPDYEPTREISIAAIAEREGKDPYEIALDHLLTNGARADFLTLAVRTGGEGHGGISLLLFPTDTPGFQVSRRLEKVGNPSSDTAVLYFDDCRVPARWLLGEEGAGFGYVMTNFQGERLVAAVQAVAAMQQMVEDAIRYGEERKAFGRPIVRFQAWRHKLAEHLTAIEAARWLTYRACDLFDRGQVAVREISMAKLFACDLAQDVAYDCMQLHGGMGYVLETDIARAWRDVRVMTIAGGTSEIMKELVARQSGL